MIRIAGVVKESIVDGKGIRFTLFTQGCPHGCKGCHNPESHNINGGYDIEAEKVIAEFNKNPLLSGITFSGGEPIIQAKELIPIAEAVTRQGKNCWIYSGWTFEELMEKNDADINKLLSLCDVLVDGKYEENERDLTLLFRGSLNQRIIDLKKSLSLKKAIILE